MTNLPRVRVDKDGNLLLKHPRLDYWYFFAPNGELISGRYTEGRGERDGWRELVVSEPMNEEK